MPTIVKCLQATENHVSESGSKGLVFRSIFSKIDGFQMEATYNDILPGGNSKNHSHPDEHIAFIVKGKGKLMCGEESFNVFEGMAIYLMANEPHCFYNTGDEILVTFGIRGFIDRNI